jgi:Excisionase from transposon Tn916.
MIQEIGMEKEEVEKGVIPVWKRYALTIAEAADYYHNRGKQTAYDCRGTPTVRFYYYEWQPHIAEKAKV